MLREVVFTRQNKVDKHVIFIKQKNTDTLCLQNKIKTESLQTCYAYKTTTVYIQVMFSKQNKMFTDKLCLQNKQMFTKQNFYKHVMFTKQNTKQKVYKHVIFI